jgi:glycosyltransferase involved in cell wall biosynthesis
MKILILGSKEYPMGSNKGDDPIPSGGMETYVDDIAQELSKRMGLVIVTRKFRGTKRYEKSGSIEIRRVPYLKGKYFRNPTFNFLSFFESLHFRKIDAIYPQGLIASFFGYMLSKIWRKPLVCRPAGIAYEQYRFPIDRMLFLLMRMIYSRCECVVFHSEGEKSNFIRILGFRPRRSEVILTGIPVDKFSKPMKSTKAGFGIPEESFVAGFIGRFVEVKGIEYLVEAASLMKSPGLKFLLVGDGPQRKKIGSQIKRLGLEDRFVFTGFTRDIPKALASMDIFIISSVSEGLPTSLLEAMAAGKACIVTDIGLPVKDMKTGLVVPAKSPKDLAAAMDRLVHDSELRKRLGSNARGFAQENCRPEKAAERHLEIFTDLVKRK